MTAVPPATSNAQRWLAQLQRGEDLAPDDARSLARALIEEDLPEALVGALLSALSSKGESEEEIFAFAQTLRERARAFPGPREAGAVDLCGTGGATRPTFNISTVSAFVVAGAGASVAKHGNASARGPCGSSDLLEALGLPVKTSVAFAEASWREARLAFLHAPLFHTATRRVAPVRRALGTRTIFNLLGPLTSPAAVRFQLVGCLSKPYARSAAATLARVGVERFLLVHGARGADELVPDGPGWTLGGGSTEGALRLEEGRVDPREYLSRGECRGDLSPLPPVAAAETTRRVLSGKEQEARMGAVLLTSGAALEVSRHARDLAEGVALARAAIEEGRAREKLESLTALSRSRTWASEAM